ncbi:MAG: dihydroneopterin aldolase [Bacteroidales bacterium]|nr:dihydroneopterin aldolase [Bacteroidales bacterium]
MATITISGMSFYAHHGCFAEEQTIGTHFRADLTYTTDTSRAELTDDIAQTVSYLDVYQAVAQQMQQPSHLLEHLARRILNAILAQFPAIQSAEVKVSKLAPPLGGQIESVSITLEAHR